MLLRIVRQNRACIASPLHLASSYQTVLSRPVSKRKQSVFSATFVLRSPCSPRIQTSQRPLFSRSVPATGFRTTGSRLSATSRSARDRFPAQAYCRTLRRQGTSCASPRRSPLLRKRPESRLRTETPSQASCRSVRSGGSGRRILPPPVPTAYRAPSSPPPSSAGIRRYRTR